MILHAKFPTYPYKFMKSEHIAIFILRPLRMVFIILFLHLLDEVNMRGEQKIK